MAALVLVFLFLPLPLAQRAAAAPESAPLDYDIANGHFFTQANGAAPGASADGYSVVDDQVASFWTEFNRLGGVQKLGYPISRRFLWNGFVCQAFQKVVMQWRPEAGLAYFVNVLDMMHDQGLDAWLLTVRATPSQLDPSFDEGKSWEQVRDARWALLDSNPAIRDVYWAVGDALNLYGLPTAKIEDEGPVYVLRAQRVIIQQWKDDVPWAKKGQVTIANGGDVAKEAHLLPTDALVLESSPQPSGTAPSQPEVMVPPPSTGTIGFGYGMCIDPGNDLPRAIAMLKAAGFNWAKVQVRWENLEGSKGAINWGTMDDIVNKVNGAGVNLLFSVVTAPRWARPADTDFGVPGPPANPKDYADFVGAIAARYKGKVQAYEIWNEQNMSFEWGGTGHKLNAAQYVQLLRQAYAAIKAADPGATVLSGALTPTGVNDGDIAIDTATYLQQMYDAGLKDVSDAVAAHPSGFANPPDDMPGSLSKTTSGHQSHYSEFFRGYEVLHQVMERYGDGNKKLWFTEFGWASSPNPPAPMFDYARDNSDSDQATYLVRAFQIAKAAGYVGPMMVWNLNYAGSAGAGDPWAFKPFGILNADWSPRPAYTALAAMPK
jgi:hypothetical protein